MLFSVVVVSFLFIGSSVAVPSDLEKMSSLGNLHSKFMPFLKKVSTLYGGFNILQTTDEYKAFNQKKKEIQAIQTKMSNNQANMSHSPHLVEAVPTADEVIASWRADAFKLIDDCINDATQYTEIEENDGNDVSETVSNGIKDATETTMKAINKERYIIPQQKYSNCPIYAKLKAVYTMYASSEEIAAFEGAFGAAPGPSS